MLLFFYLNLRNFLFDSLTLAGWKARLTNVVQAQAMRCLSVERFCSCFVVGGLSQSDR